MNNNSMKEIGKVRVSGEKEEEQEEKERNICNNAGSLLKYIKG